MRSRIDSLTPDYVPTLCQEYQRTRNHFANHAVFVSSAAGPVTLLAVIGLAECLSLHVQHKIPGWAGSCSITAVCILMAAAILGRAISEPLQERRLRNMSKMKKNLVEMDEFIQWKKAPVAIPVNDHIPAVSRWSKQISAHADIPVSVIAKPARKYR